ncbi:Hint domain-containing protein [Seohaeicola saemankumensis]|nr:Hint domain-containing protein [Seohaeicola saemankumensis]MCA0872682.1 Hint domain-containing protein [Seohaeicola saemankumensis]
MTAYSIDIFAMSDATTSVAGIIEQYMGGDQWDWYAASNPTLSLNSGATATAVAITDSDGGVAGGTLDDDGFGQTLTTDVTIGGVTHTAGSIIENEYEINLSDGTTTYRFVAISINDSIIGFTWEGAVPPEDATLSYTSGNAFDFQSMVPCFTPGSMIATGDGERAVERLRPGDRVVTADHGLQRIMWLRARRLDAAGLARSPHLRPITFAPGSLGEGLPAAALSVSPQHRMLVRSKIAERMADQPEVLVAAKHLCGLPGIAATEGTGDVTYVHFLLERHEIVFANSAPTESMLRGEMALRSLSCLDRRAVERLFPGIRRGAPERPARAVLNGRAGRELARRHGRNQQTLVRGMAPIGPSAQYRDCAAGSSARPPG